MRVQGLRQTCRQEMNGKNGLHRRVQVGEDEISRIFEEESIALNEKFVASEVRCHSFPHFIPNRTCLLILIVLVHIYIYIYM
jgi:hypothetical protein